MGEILEGLPGSESVARRKRDARNLGGPVVSLERVGCTDQTKGTRWAVGSQIAP
jgi:hypothetical protein